MYETLEEWVRDLVAAPLGWDPGTEWNYHTASDVWGYLVEYFSGRSLQDYVKETILDPLGIGYQASRSKIALAAGKVDAFLDGAE